uniref:hypothetical protein n=1 Tax=Xanthomonas albilineans TaxID=29447 RepID=UPI0027DE55D1|nr:hypothetical protein [Xanthomonas albilineans]
MTLQPVAQRALLAAFNSPGYRLRRAAGGFVGAPPKVHTSGLLEVPAFTRRAVNWLDNAGLVTFDDPEFPSCVALNARGVAEAQKLLASLSKVVR